MKRNFSEGLSCALNHDPYIRGGTAVYARDDSQVQPLSSSTETEGWHGLSHFSSSNESLNAPGGFFTLPLSYARAHRHHKRTRSIDAMCTSHQTNIIVLSLSLSSLVLGIVSHIATISWWSITLSVKYTYGHKYQSQECHTNVCRPNIHY